MSEATRFGLKPETIDVIRSVLADFGCITEAVLYGSRAMGTFRPGSDIDLALKTTNEIPRSLAIDIETRLDDLDLPYSFDISLLAQISNADLREHIDRVGVVFYSTVSHNETGHP